MENIRDSFIFYRSFYQAAKKLPKEDKAEIFDAICSYALDGEEMDLSVVPEAIFTVIKPNLDANRKRWANGCKDKTKTNSKEEIIKTEAKDKQTVSKTEGNKDKDKDKDLNVNKNINNNIDQFEEFWNLYNYKKAKPKALLAYKKALKSDTHDNIIAGVNAYIKARGSDSQYWKHPTTWLNAESWNDEYTTTQSNTNQNLVDRVNKILGSDLVVKIESNLDQAIISTTQHNWKKLTSLNEKIKESIKLEISNELKTISIRPKYIDGK